MRRPEKTIDPEIRGLCGALNSHPAVKTFYSYQGHEWRRWPSVERPYVVFEAPSELTFALQKFLDACIASGSLNYYWTLKGGWLDESFQWTLEVSDIQLDRPWAWSRRRVRQDFAHLARWVLERAGGAEDFAVQPATA